VFDGGVLETPFSGARKKNKYNTHNKHRNRSKEREARRGNQMKSSKQWPHKARQEGSQEIMEGCTIM
jgi:hypothetical protein